MTVVKAFKSIVQRRNSKPVLMAARKETRVRFLLKALCCYIISQTMLFNLTSDIFKIFNLTKIAVRGSVIRLDNLKDSSKIYC